VSTRSLAVALLAYSLVDRAGVISPAGKCRAKIAPEEQVPVGTRYKMVWEVWKTEPHEKLLGNWQRIYGCYLWVGMFLVSGVSPRLCYSNYSLARL